MKILRSAIVALAMGVTLISSAAAHDSFNVGINVGGYGYPQARYYAAPPVIYYNAPPVVYYGPAPRVYNYAPNISYGYQTFGNQHGYQSRRYDNRWDNNSRWNNRGHDGHRGHRNFRGHR